MKCVLHVHQTKLLQLIFRYLFFAFAHFRMVLLFKMFPNVFIQIWLQWKTQRRALKWHLIILHAILLSKGLFFFFFSFKKVCTSDVKNFLSWRHETSRRSLIVTSTRELHHMPFVSTSIIKVVTRYKLSAIIINSRMHMLSYEVNITLAITYSQLLQN